MKNLPKKMMTLGVVLISVVMSAPVLLAGTHDLSTGINGNDTALTSEAPIGFTPKLFAMKNLMTTEGATFNRLTESELDSIEGKFSFNFRTISINIAPRIQIAFLTQFNVCAFCFGTNQNVIGGIFQ